MTQKTKKRIFITGASSFIGKTLIEKLQDNYDISVLIHKKNLDIANDDLLIVYGGMENVKEWGGNLANVDIIIHLAGISYTKNINVYKKINSKGTQNLIKAAKHHKVKQFIFVSSRTCGTCCGAYGASKEMAENYLKKSDLVYTILRIGEVYDSNFSRAEGLGGIFYLIKKSPLIPYPYGKQSTLAPINRDDVQKIMLSVVGNRITYNKTYTVAGPENLYLKEVMNRICKQQKLKRILIPVPMFFISLILFIFFNLFRKGAPDQLQRFLCKKNPLSNNVFTDLNIKPKPFLFFS